MAHPFHRTTRILQNHSLANKDINLQQTYNCKGGIVMEASCIELDSFLLVYNMKHLELVIKQEVIEKDKANKIKRFHGIFSDKMDWKIHSGKWSRLSAHHAFQHSPQIYAKIIQLYGNKQPKILKSIKSPKMLNLTHLNLRNNKIISIEGISHFKTPNLTVLSLGDNQINSIKQLPKLYAPELSQLNANRIVDLQPLSKVYFPNLKIIILGLNSISNFKPLNKCIWPLIEKISIQNNRKCCKMALIVTKWTHKPQIIYG